MSDTVRLRTPSGDVHYTARGSQAAEHLLRDGAVDLDAPTTTDTPVEVTDASPAGQGDDHDTGTTGGGSRKRQRATGATGRGDETTGEV